MTQPPNSPTPRSDLFRRDGHVTELALDRYRLGELDADATAEVDAHLDGCAECAAMHDRLVAFDADFLNRTPMPDFGALAAAKAAEAPQPAQDAPQARPMRDAQPRPERVQAQRARQAGRARWGRALGYIAVAAAAAVIALVAAWSLGGDTPQGADPGAGLGPGVNGTPSSFVDDTRIKGSGFNLEVHLQRDATTRVLNDGDTVHPDDPLGFVVYPKRPGHLLIVGVDATHKTYPCHPQDANAASAPVDAAQDAVQVPSAIALDGVLGVERIVALYCPEPFALADVRDALEAASKAASDDAELPSVRPACAQQEVTLIKRSGAAPEAP